MDDITSIGNDIQGQGGDDAQLLTGDQTLDPELIEAFSCEPYSLIEHHSAPGGKAYKGGNDLKKCKEFCKADVDCLGFDFVKSANPWKNIRCWVFYKDQIIKTCYTNDDVDHYSKQLCETGEFRQTIKSFNND